MVGHERKGRGKLMCSGGEEKAEGKEDEKKAISKLSFLSPVKGNICRS